MWSATARSRRLSSPGTFTASGVSRVRTTYVGIIVLLSAFSLLLDQECDLHGGAVLGDRVVNELDDLHRCDCCLLHGCSARWSSASNSAGPSVRTPSRPASSRFRPGASPTTT